MINQFEFSPTGLPLKRGDILQVNVVGTPRAKATYRFVGYTSEIPMREVQPGRYEAQVQIGSRLKIKDGTIQVLLTNEQGKVLRNSDKKITIKGLP